MRITIPVSVTKMELNFTLAAGNGWLDRNRVLNLIFFKVVLQMNRGMRKSWKEIYLFFLNTAHEELTPSIVSSVTSVQEQVIATPQCQLNGICYTVNRKCLRS